MRNICFYFIYGVYGNWGFCEDRSNIKFTFTDEKVNTCCDVVKMRGLDLAFDLPGVNYCLFDR